MRWAWHLSLSALNMAPAASREYRGLPGPLLAYLKKTADPRLLLKLMQVSRYFWYTEFPYMVVKDLRYYRGGWEYWERSDSGALVCQILDFDNLTKPLWISNKLILSDPNDSNLLSLLLSKTAVCDVTALDISGQNLTMKQFEILVSSKNVQDFKFYKNLVTYDDGDVVPVDEIVKLLPHLKDFYWFPHGVASSILTSTAKLVEYLNPSTLTRFEVQYLTETFDFKLFAEFMDKHHSIHFRLGFDHHVSYGNMIRAYINQLENRNFRIKFPYAFYYC